MEGAFGARILDDVAAAVLPDRRCRPKASALAYDEHVVTADETAVNF
jgi:hypothetical protein